MKKIKLIALLVLILALVGGCASNTPAPAPATPAPSTPAPAAKVKIKVAATPVPHAEILAQVKEDLNAKGFELEVVEFSDYVQPNLVVDAKDMDANFFQHKPYLDSFNKEKGTKIVSVASIHYEPLGIYPGKSKDLKNIPQGATIAVPNDTTNEARALLLLEANGIIKIKPGAGLTATKNDIVENPKKVQIVELEAAQVARVVGETDFVVLNGNYALQAKFNVAKDSLAKEEATSDAAKTYANILCVKEGNENNPGIKALAEALKSDKVKKFITEKYSGAVIPMN